MKIPLLKLIVCGFAVAGSLRGLHAAEPLELQQPLKPEPVKKTFVFSLLPKALKDKPLLAVTVITEATEAGKKVKPPTSQEPAYYVVMASGYHMEGAGQSQEATISKESLLQEVRKSLAEASYRECSDEHPASLVLSLVWGEHLRLPAEFDVNHDNLISRARVVGGLKFAEDLAEAVAAKEAALLAQQGSDDPIPLDPMYLFSIRSDKNRVLVDQVYDDCYFVVVSAYDKVAYDKGEMKLLWRTKMTTAAHGVSLAETSTALIGSGARYFGKWMTEASIIDKRINRKGKVELGETRTVSMDEPAEHTEKTKDAADKKK